MRSSTFCRAAVVLVFLTAATAFAGSPIEGTWTLDERASSNAPDSVKGVELKITVKGKELTTQRFFEGRSLGEPVSLKIDAGPEDKEIGKGQRGTVEIRSSDAGKTLEQTVRMKEGGVTPVVQTTLTTISDDGQVMTRQQTTTRGGEKTERRLVYRKKS